MDSVSRSPASLVPPHDRGAAAIYRDEYAALYPSLYIDPWPAKHALNIRNLSRVLDGVPARRPVWLDLACGQAWHFSMFPGRARMIGLDLSAAQLARARGRACGASFIRQDMAQASFRPGSFDVVTNFWAGYCYLGSEARIGRLLRHVVSWIRPGGALYMEVLLPRDLESFNRSRFAGRTGFSVVPRSADYSDWRYDDVGGRHEMTSPPLELFLGETTAAFDHVDATHDGAFMVHLIASGRKRDESSRAKS